MRGKPSPEIEKIGEILQRIAAKANELPISIRMNPDFSLALSRAVANIRQLQLEDAEAKIKTLEEQMTNSSFAKAEEYRVELEATKAFFDNDIFRKAIGRIPEKAVNEITKRLVDSLAFPEEEEDGVKKIRVKVGEDQDGGAIIKWACGKTIEQLVNAVVRLHIENGLLNDIISPATGQAVEVAPLQASNLGRTGRVKFAEYAHSWLEIYHKKTTKETTFKTDKGYVNKHLVPYFGEMYLDQITMRDVQMFLDSRGEMKKPNGEPYARKTIDDMWKLANQIFDMAVEEEYIIKSPSQSKKLTNPSDIVTTREALTKEQAQIIAETIPHIEKQMDKRLIALLLYTGMRRSEILGLMWEDIITAKSKENDEEILIFNVVRGVTFPSNQPIIGDTKTEKSKRHVPIAQALWAHLQPEQKSGFIVHRGKDPTKPITESTYDRSVERIEKQIELHDTTAHGFRHTYITLLAEEGVPLSIIQELVGHESITTTMRYIHVHDEEVTKGGLKIGRILSGS